MKYTQIPQDTFEKLQMNAGILARNFDPHTGVVEGLIGATSGGINFTDTPEYADFGEDIDNAPKNTKELKKITGREIAVSGTFVTVDGQTAKMLSGAADLSDISEDESENLMKVTPRTDLKASDFETIWFIGDYSDVNTGAGAGFLAIKVMNALNTTGFQIQSGDKAKGQFAFTFTGHYSMDAQDVVPYEIYIKGAGVEPTPHILLDSHTVHATGESDVILRFSVYPANAEVTATTETSDVTCDVSDSDNIITVSQAGGVTSAVIVASITVDDVDYTDTCTVIWDAPEI